MDAGIRWDLHLRLRHLVQILDGGGKYPLNPGTVQDREPFLVGSAGCASPDGGEQFVPLRILVIPGIGPGDDPDGVPARAAAEGVGVLTVIAVEEVDGPRGGRRYQRVGA